MSMSDINAQTSRPKINERYDFIEFTNPTGQYHLSFKLFYPLSLGLEIGESVEDRYPTILHDNLCQFSSDHSVHVGRNQR